MKRLIYISFILLSLNWVPSGFAGIVEYDLNISYKTLNIDGRDVKAMVLNDSNPGPTLHFREGDIARIRFKNSMEVYYLTMKTLPPMRPIHSLNPAKRNNLNLLLNSQAPMYFIYIRACWDSVVFMDQL